MILPRGPMPVLLHETGRSYFINGSRVRLFDGPLNGPQDFTARLERLELARASGQPGARTDDLWVPGAAVAEFLGLVRDELASGNHPCLQYVPIAHSSLPLEIYFGRQAHSDAEPVAVVRSRTLTPRNVDSSSTRLEPVVIFQNPLGDPYLEHASEEASKLASAAEAAGLEYRCISRGVHESELAGLLSDAGSLFYMGHGRNVGGYLAIPVHDGWAGLVPSGFSGPRPLIFFDACLSSADAPLLEPGVVFAPACRLVDRPQQFAVEFLQALHAHQDLVRAWSESIATDAAAGDIRGLLFRLHCSL